ncbi:N-glycosylase/DNA lyase [Labeo rohita]|uniref:DNA-(apurinic or apyrimidinic site) lyase n=1 Tax=Labeo rohita TaxID=84645 RepID=A0ABQ8MEB4_LABRO|nr:N-glycosylase/DNA lyase [Labeo rohita]
MSQHALLSAGCKAWRSLSCPRWRETADDHWTGVMRGKVWTLTQTEDTLWYYVYSHQIHAGTENRLKQVKDEEQLLGNMPKRKMEIKQEIDIKQEEAGLCTVIGSLQGLEHRVRLLRQDPIECLFSFICSSNNHISRIQGMVDRLCQTLGTLLCKLDDVAYHDFPPLQALTDPSVEMRLRDLGFGYRARFLQQSSQTIVNSHGPDWLQSLRSAPYLQARDALRSLPGVGLKVADCVCLMSLDKFEALPVDTHVWQIAKRDYSFAAGNSQKTLTDRRFQKLKEEIPVLKDEKTELKKKMKERRHDRNEEKQSEKGKKHQRT